MDISTKKKKKRKEGLKRRAIFREVLVGLDVLKNTVQVKKIRRTHVPLEDKLIIGKKKL